MSSLEGVSADLDLVAPHVQNVRRIIGETPMFSAELATVTAEASSHHNVTVPQDTAPVKKEYQVYVVISAPGDFPDSFLTASHVTSASGTGTALSRTWQLAAETWYVGLRISI